MTIKSIIYKIYIPEILQSQLATLYHEKLGHFGFWKTFKAMTQFYYWKNMRKTVKIVVRTCVICQKSKVPNQTSTGIMKSIIPLNQNELLAVDLFGPLPTSIAGVKYIFVILNVFTKYIKLYKLKKPTTRAIIGKLKNDYFIRVRKPERILSDNGTQFRSKQWDTFLRENHIDNLHCSIRHPQSNPSERTMRELGRLLRVYCHNKHTSWAKYTTKIEMLINCAVHESTEAAPITLETGRMPGQEIKRIISFPGQPDETTKVVLIREKLLSKAEAGQKKQRNTTKKYTKFEVGQSVWLKANNMSSAEDGEIKKLFLLYEGPYRIKDIAGHNAYTLENTADGSIRGVFNVVSLKPHITE